jgi:hypothetical protein
MGLERIVRVGFAQAFPLAANAGVVGERLQEDPRHGIPDLK